MLDSDETIANALIDAYSKCSDMGEAHKMFEVAPVKSVVSWSSMVSGYADRGENLTAIGLYNAMCRLDKKPDRVIYLSVMKACAKLRSSSYAKEIHDHIVRVGIEDDTTIGNSLINMYAKCGVLDEASKVFSRLPCKDVLSWGAIMDGHACHGGLHGYIQQCLQGIDEQGLKPNDVIFLNLLSVCGHVGAVTTGVKLFHSMDVGHGIIPNIKHITSMVDLLSRAGSLGEAKCMLSGNLNFTGWTSLLSACRVYGAQP
jgi:pentatricopeptide repeat protein